MQKTAPSPLTKIPPRATRRAAYPPRRADVATEQHRHTADVQPTRESTTEQLPRIKHKRRGWFLGLVLPLLQHRYRNHVLAGMIATFVFLQVMSMVVVPWFSVQLDHWQYGTARLAQYDINVGHHGTSHFLTEFYHGHAIVVEFAGENAAHTYLYSLMVTSDTDRTPRVVTLRTARINLHGAPGKPDLLVGVTGIAVYHTLYNTGDAFSTSLPTS